MLRSDEPYAVIALDERDFGPHRRHELSISLTLAFLLSARLRFHFPMSDDVSREVDRAFDQVLKGLPMESKGIAYRKDLRCYGKICLLDRLGAIGQGKIVDLILLEANPSENVENTKRIAAAVVGGKLLPKESLKGMLAEAEATIADRERQR